MQITLEMFKVSNNYSTSLMSEIFAKGNNVYDFRNPSDEVTSMVQKVFLFLALIVAPSELKQSETVNGFKREIKKWKSVNCFCRVCWPRVHNVGFS